MCEKIFYFILDAAVTAGIAAAAVIIARLFLRRAPKKWAYMMWAVVFFRCLCPFSAESGFSLFNAFEGIFSADKASVSEALPTEGGVNVPISFDADNAPAEIIFAPEKGEIAENAAGVPQTQSEKKSAQVYTILLAVWVCGAAAMALYGVIASLSLKRRIKTAVKTEDGIFESDRIATAFTAGLFRPRIYLPCGLPPEQRELIILHERVHIRRRDYILKPLAFAGLAVQWFDPLIWAAFALMTRDMEMSCDEAVLRICGTDKRTAYSEALLNASVRGSGIAAWTGFGESGIKERVKNVLDYKKPKLAATLLAAAVMLTACGTVGTDAKDAKTDIPSGTAAAETGAESEKNVQSETEAAGSQNEESGRSLEDIINEDTSKYFPVNSKGKTYGSGSVKDENGIIVYPDLIAALGINGTVGYITKAGFYGYGGDDPLKYISGLRAELVMDEELEAYREQYKDSRDDYRELRFIRISSELPMYDSEGELLDDVFCSGVGVYILGESLESEIKVLGVKITIDEAGNVKAESKDGNKIEVDSYIPKVVFNEVTGKLEFAESHPVLSETGGDEAEDSKAYLYFNSGETGGELSELSSEERAELEAQRLREEEQAKQSQLSEEQARPEEEAKAKRLSEEQAKLEEIHQQFVSELETLPEYQKFKEDIKSSYSKIKKPVDSPIIDPYGESDGVGLDGKSFHKGVNFKAAEGDAVCAADGGKVIAASDKGNGYGMCVIIDHGNGMSTLYAHLSEASVSVDDEVEQGDEIGKAGHTGAIYGDGLHFEVRINGQHVDPMDYLDN